jgi:tetratricopeptide (TPR) repeat protein
LTDFSVEILGVILPATAILGTIRGRRRENQLLGEIWVSRHVGVVSFIALAAAALVTLLPWAAHARLKRETEAVAGLLDGKTPPDIARQKLRQAVQHHPADYFLQYLGGLWAMETSGEYPLRWFNRSLLLNSRFGWTHYQIARVLFRTGKVDQALIEYVLAVDDEGQALGPMVAKEVARAKPDFEAIRSVALRRDTQKFFWNLLAGAWSEASNHAQAALADEALLVIDPQHPDALMRSAFRAEIAKQPDVVIANARKLAPSRPVLAARLEATAWAAKGDHKRAVTTIQTALEAAPGDRELLQALADREEAAGYMEEARRALEKLAERAPSTAEICRIRSLQAELEIRQSMKAAALAIFKRAGAACEGILLEKAAALAEEIGDLLYARDGFRRLGQRSNGATFAERAARLEDRIRQLQGHAPTP